MDMEEMCIRDSVQQVAVVGNHLVQPAGGHGVQHTDCLLYTSGLELTLDITGLGQGVDCLLYTSPECSEYQKPGASADTPGFCL